MREIIKKYIKKKIPLSSKHYNLDLDKNFHTFKAKRKSYYKKDLSKLSFNELCILFKTDKATLYEDIIYDFTLKKYVRSLVTGHGYSRYYSQINKNVVKNLVEIGSYEGASGLVFSSYFQKAKIYCLDINFKNNKLKYKNSKRVKIDQLNKDDLKKFIIKNKLKNKIDLISDDAAHLNRHIINSFEVLFPNLRKGGCYFIEDINIKRNKKVYDLFRSYKKNSNMDIKIVKSNLNNLTQSNTPQNYLIILKKRY